MKDRGNEGDTGKPGGAGTAEGGAGGGTRIYPQTSHTDRLLFGIRIVEFRFREWKPRQINADAGSVTKGKIGKIDSSSMDMQMRSVLVNEMFLGKGREIVAINVLTRQIILALKQSRDKYTS